MTESRLGQSVTDQIWRSWLSVGQDLTNTFSFAKSKCFIKYQYTKHVLHHKYDDDQKIKASKYSFSTKNHIF